MTPFHPFWSGKTGAVKSPINTSPGKGDKIEFLQDHLGRVLEFDNGKSITL